MAYSTVTLTGTYQKFDATPAEGVIEIIPSEKQVKDTAGNVILSGRVKVTLDAAGSFSVDLPATDDQGLNPTNFGYTLVAKLRHTHLPAVSFSLPAATPTVDIEDVTTVDPSTFDPTATYVEPTDLATVATTGAYVDLTGQPTIPSTAADVGALPDTTTAADLGAQSAATLDTDMAALVPASSGSETAGALSATFATGGQVRSKVKTDGTDQTATLQAEVDDLMANGGGTLLLPEGVVTLLGTLALTNDAATPPKQATLVLQGQGAHWSGRGTAPVGGTTLDIQGTDAYGKVKTNGLGLLGIHGVTFQDSAGTATPFVYTTNTTLHIDGCAFVGSKVGTACDQDAIVCGGTQQVEGGAGWDDGFQGYGTVISRNYFNGIRRAVWGRAFFNANVIRDNTVWSLCGSNLPDGAAFELDGKPTTGTQASVGNVFTGNLVECPNYPYAFKAKDSVRNSYLGNNCYDETATTLAFYRFEDTAQYNLVVSGFYNASKPLVSDATAQRDNTFIDPGNDNWFRTDLRALNFVADSIPNVSSQFQWADQGVNKFQLYMLSGDPNLYLRDLREDRMHATFTPAGTGIAAAYKKFYSVTDFDSRLVARGPIVFPTVSTADRGDAAVSGAGATVFDSTLKKLITYDGSAWYDQNGTAV